MRVNCFNKFLMIFVLLMGVCFILCDNEDTSTANTASTECPVCDCGDTTAPTIVKWTAVKVPGDGQVEVTDGNSFVDNENYTEIDPPAGYYWVNDSNNTKLRLDTSGGLWWSTDTYIITGSIKDVVGNITMIAPFKLIAIAH